MGEKAKKGGNGEFEGKKTHNKRVYVFTGIFHKHHTALQLLRQICIPSS